MGLQMLAAAAPVGGYINGWLLIPVVLLLLAWAKALSWVDKDAEAARLGRDWINTGMMGGLIIAVAAFFILPNFFLAYVAMLVVVGIEAGIYLSMRQKAVGLGDLKGDFKAWVLSFGRERKPVQEIAGAVQIVGPSGQLLPAPKVNTPEAESYQGIQTMLTDPLINNAEIIDMAPSETGLSVRYMVDGVYYNGASVNRQVGAAAIAYLKAAANLDIGEVRKPQKGTLKLNVNSKRRELQVDTKGSTAGEFARFTADAKKRHDFTPGTLGFTEEQLNIIKGTVQGGGGITLLTMPRGTGLTSLSYAMLRAHDAFLQNIRSIERDPEQELEGITQEKLPKTATPEEEAKQAAWIISQQPDVVLMAKPENPKTIANFIDAAKDGKRIYISFNANSTGEALWQFVRMVGDPRLALSQLQLVINGRVLRKLCSACKQGYAPDPEQLRKMNMDPSRVEMLYQARKEPLRDPKGNPIKCEFCNDLRYKGRTGMYELLQVDEPIKAIVTNGMTPEQNAGPLKTAFRKQKGKYLQEVGLGMVEDGDTSVQEVLRVLKVSDNPTSGSTAAPRTAPRKPKGPEAA